MRHVVPSSTVTSQVDLLVIQRYLQKFSLGLGRVTDLKICLLHPEEATPVCLVKFELERFVA